MKNKKLLLPIAAGLGIALFSRKTNGTSKKAPIDKGFVFKCNPVEFYITDKDRAFEYTHEIAASLIKKYPDPDTIDFQAYLKDYLLKVSPQCYKLYISDKLSREASMATSLVFLQGFTAYLRETFGPEYINAYVNKDEDLDLSEEQKLIFDEYIIYFENYAQPQWLKILNTFNFTQQELEKISQIELSGKL